MGFEDQFTHRIGHEEARISAHGDQLAHFRRRNLQLRDRMNVNTSGALFVQVIDSPGAAVHQKLAQRSHSRRSPPRTMRDHQMGQLQEFSPLMPLGQTEEGIHADNETEAPVRILMPQLGQGLHGIRWPLLAHLAVIDGEARLTFDRQLDHLQALLGAGKGLVPVRRIARRQETNFLQTQRLLQLESRPQVRVVNGIESAAEYAHGIHADTLLESADACKAPAMAAANPVSAVHASPPVNPLITRSV